MKITKNQLRRIIKEEKAKLSERLEVAPGVSVFNISMRIAVDPNAIDMLYKAIEDGMEFNEDDGEGILSYDIKEEQE